MLRAARTFFCAQTQLVSPLTKTTDPIIVTSLLNESNSLLSYWVASSRQYSQKRQVVVQLKEDIDGLGTEGDFVKVKPGYARNFLYPAGKVRLLDQAERKVLKAQPASSQESAASTKQSEQQELSNNLVELPRVVRKLSTQTLLVRRMPTADNPNTFGRHITADDVIQYVEKQMKIRITRDMFELPAPIDTMGLHRLPLKLNPKLVKLQHFLRLHVFDNKTKKEDSPDPTLVVEKDDVVWEDYTGREEQEEDEEDKEEVVVERAPRTLPSADRL